jgi:FKBP-type peptidyl-prolyl cis-trans isomerase FklB
MFRMGVAVAFALFAGIAAAQEATAFKTEKEKISYALGMDLAEKIRAQGMEVDAEFLARAIRESLTGGKTLLTEEEKQATLTALQKDLRAKQAEARRAQAEGNLKEGAAFLAENKTKEGVVTLPSGLQYKVLRAGDGKKPTADDTVVVHYRGTLIDGTEFDSSYKRNQPTTLPVKGVVKGWTEALQLMPVGSKWQLFLPTDLAYGERGGGRVIGPNAALVFEVELLSIKEKPAATAP